MSDEDGCNGDERRTREPHENGTVAYDPQSMTPQAVERERQEYGSGEADEETRAPDRVVREAGKAVREPEQWRAEVTEHDHEHADD